MKKQKPVKEKEVLGDVKSFVVDRETWYRGKGAGKSCLLNTNGKLCCLGFYARSCGVEDRLMRNIGDPNNLVEMLDGEKTIFDIKVNHVNRKANVLWETKLVHNKKNSDICNKLMTVNDSETFDTFEREKKLTALFKKIGIKVKFVGEKK